VKAFVPRQPTSRLKSYPRREMGGATRARNAIWNGGRVDDTYLPTAAFSVPAADKSRMADVPFFLCGSSLPNAV